MQSDWFLKLNHFLYHSGLANMLSTYPLCTELVISRSVQTGDLFLSCSQ